MMLRLTKGPFVRLKNLTGFEVIGYRDDLWLLHKCGFHERITIVPFLTNIISTALEHHNEGCME